MKLIFQLRFHTEPGQSLWLTGDHEMFGSGRAEQAIPLQYLNPELWQATIHLPAGTAPDAQISYHYLLRNADGSVVEDWDNKRINPVTRRSSFKNMGVNDRVLPFKRAKPRSTRYSLR